MKSLGRHLLLEFYDCGVDFLNNPAKVEKVLVAAAKAAQTQIIKTVFHRFNPYGVSGVVVIAESHLAIHTWPEYKFASIDIYTCGWEVDPWKAYHFLKEKFKTKTVTVMELKRGILNLPEEQILHKPKK